VVSGSALLSTTSDHLRLHRRGGDAVFSVLPDGDRWANVHVAGLPLKLQVELSAFVILVLLNLRGVKES